MRTYRQRLEHIERLRERRHEALRLREDGKTVQEVGNMLGISKQLASRIIKEAQEERDG